MEKTARAIVIYDNKYVLIHRKKIKDGKLVEYYATPGGHLEENETFESACIREVKEELGIDVNIDSLFFEYINEEVGTYEKYFNVSYISGKVGTGNGEEFTNRDFEKYGSYDVAYVSKEELKNINLLPLELKERLLTKI